MSELTSRKQTLGQYFTRASSWLYPQIHSFISQVNPSIVVDPFVGEGDLLNVIQKEFKIQIEGLDIDPKTTWKQNDSLKFIPRYEGGLILTNPPYLSNYSAKRKGILENVQHYFLENPQHDDLYRIALDLCLKKNDYVIAIVPETFINSTYTKERLRLITIVEDQLFEDTETPVCIACFGPNVLGKTEVYRGAAFIGFFEDILRLKIYPNNSFDISFNDPVGQIGLRAVDMPDPSKPIAFLPIQKLGYDLKKIKVSSRLITSISLPLTLEQKTEAIIQRSNEILSQFRRETQDVLLSPFKGNTKQGNRRRRLDYATARGILESAIRQEIQHVVKI